MDAKHFAHTNIPLISFIIFISVWAYLLFLRPPVVLVTDAYFSALYGERDGQMRRYEASLKTFRQIKVVLIVEDSDSLSIIEAITKAAKNPYAVFFPFSYSEAAGMYTRTLQETGNDYTRSYVFIGKEEIPQNASNNYFVRSDSALDFYRAGYIASILNEDNMETLIDEKIQRTAYIIYDSAFYYNEDKMFMQGLQDGGFNGKSVVASGSEPKKWLAAAAVLIDSPAYAFIQSQGRSPVMLFSWFGNRNYLPANVIVHIDDSPYHQIPLALRKVRSSDPPATIYAVPSRFESYNERLKHNYTRKMMNKAILSIDTSALNPK